MREELYVLEDTLNKRLDTELNQYDKYGNVEFECEYNNYGKVYIKGEFALYHLDTLKNTVLDVFNEFGLKAEFDDVDYDTGCCEYFSNESVLPVHF